MKNKKIKNTDAHCYDVIVIGAGLSGVATGVKLQQANITNYLILEKNNEIGGVWRDNTYPGCECDIPSALYSYSFAPNPKWSHVFAKQDEIKAYIEDVAKSAGLDPHIKLNTELKKAVWNEKDQIWVIETAHHTYTSRFVFFAGGPLSQPVIPNISGKSKYKGAMFHSAQWDHHIDLTGKRVAIAGTGASAIQIIPAIQPQVEHLYVFQRTAPWVIPKPNFTTGNVAQTMMKNVPFLLKSIRASTDLSLETLSLGISHPKSLNLLGKSLIQWMHYCIKDPELRQKVKPEFTLRCKRILFSNTYYHALATPNTTLIAEGVSKLTETGILTQHGEIDVDVIIWSTGFEITPPPLSQKIITSNGSTLAEEWSTHLIQAYKGCIIQDLPNAIYILGPNSLNYNSFISTAELHIDYGIQAIKTVMQKNMRSFRISAHEHEKYNQQVQAALDKTVFNRGGCVSYYLNENKVNVSNYPWTMHHMRKDLKNFNTKHYEFN